jgi:general stress protein 26
MTEHHDTHPADPVTVSDDPEEVAKVHDIISGMDVAMLTTVDATSPGRLTSRPLSTQRAEEDGDVLFLVRDRSPVVRDVEAHPQVNVAYSSAKAWVSLAGTATVVRDRALVKELWSTGASAFMEGGPDNPDNVVLKVSGDTAEYWGGTSLVGTVVSTVKSMAGSKDEDAGPTVVELP